MHRFSKMHDFCWIKIGKWEWRAHLGNCVTQFVWHSLCWGWGVAMAGCTCVQSCSQLQECLQPRWRGSDGRLEPVPLSVGLMFHLPHSEGNSCPYLHLPPLPTGLEPAAARWWRFRERGSRLCHGSSAGAAITSFLCSNKRFHWQLRQGSEGGPGRPWSFISISLTPYRD